MVQGPRQATMWFDFRPVSRIWAWVGGYILTRSCRANVVGLPYLLRRASVVAARKDLCAEAMAWKAWSERRRAAAKSAGETAAVGSKSGGSIWSSRERAGSGGGRKGI